MTAQKGAKTLHSVATSNDLMKLPRNKSTPKGFSKKIFQLLLLKYGVCLMFSEILFLDHSCSCFLEQTTEFELKKDNL